MFVQLSKIIIEATDVIFPCKCNASVMGELSPGICGNHVL